MNIVPSLVEQTAQDLFDRIVFLSPYYKHFQIDIEDGIFIQNKTLPIEQFVSYVGKNHISLSPSLIYDFHFMSIDYERSMELIDQIKTFIRIEVVFIHTALHPKYLLLQDKYPHFRLGLVINPEEDVESLNEVYNFKTIPLIQLMTVHPGPQGQSFIPEALNKIELLRNYGFRGKIYIDGAINETTFPLMTSLPHKPDFLCPGSYLAKSPPEELERRVTFLQSYITHN